MKTLVDTVTDYLESENLRYTRAEDNSAIVVGYQLNNVSVSCTVTVNEASRYLSFCTRSGILVSADRHCAVVEFLTRTNHGLNIGGFLFDHRDGDILFKTSLFAGNEDVSAEVLQPLLSQSFRTYDSYYSGIVDVVYHDVDPVQALRNLKVARIRRASQEEVDTVVAKLLAGMEKAEASSDKAESLTEFDALLAQVEANPDGITLSMKELVAASGQRRAGKRIVQSIEERLLAKGLSHDPTNLPHSQSKIVRVFKRSQEA